MTALGEVRVRPGGAHHGHDGQRQVYVPHRTALPPLRAYARTLWARRAFAWELSRCELRAQHLDTLFGRLWLLLNPILLASVYFVLVDILRGGTRGGEFFARLVAGLFAFIFVQHALQHGIRSVVNAGGLILNTSFPRVLLPLSSVITAFRRFAATLPIYAAVHLAVGLPLRPEHLWAIPVLALLVPLAAGLAIAVAAIQVYLRDLHTALPYVVRAWLYLSPVLYLADEIPERFDVVLVLNPLAPLLVAWTDVVVGGRAPAAADLALGAGWAMVLLVAGAHLFLSREREFAVRL